MKLALMCSQTNLTCFADTLKDVQKIFLTKPTESIKLVDHSFYETCATKKIEQVNWPRNVSTLAFEFDDCLLSNKDIE